MNVNGPMARSDRVASLEDAKARFQKNWNAWKAMGKVGRDAVGASSIRDGNILLKYFLNLAPLDCSSHSFGHQPDDI